MWHSARDSTGSDRSRLQPPSEVSVALGRGRGRGARRDEHLAVVVDDRQGRVRLEVEVLLPGEVDLALEDVGRAGEAGGHVAALHARPDALEALLVDRLDDGDD